MDLKFRILESSNPQQSQLNDSFLTVLPFPVVMVNIFIVSFSQMGQITDTVRLIPGF